VARRFIVHHAAICGGHEPSTWTWNPEVTNAAFVIRNLYTAILISVLRQPISAIYFALFTDATVRTALDYVQSPETSLTVQLLLPDGEPLTVQTFTRHNSDGATSVSRKKLVTRITEGHHAALLKYRILAMLNMKLLVLLRMLSVLSFDATTVSRLARETAQKRAFLKEAVATIRAQMADFKKTMSLMHAKLVDIKTNILAVSNTSTNGVLIWVITDVAKRKQEAVAGTRTSFYSPPFRVLQFLYKISFRLYLDGDGLGRGSYVSLFLVLLKSKMDPVIRWTFNSKVTIIVLDQNFEEHLIDAFKSDIENASFQQPITDMNLGSGSSLFIPISIFEGSAERVFDYIKDDSVFIKFVVDVADMPMVNAFSPTFGIA
jgi:hypothetical protein